MEDKIKEYLEDAYKEICKVRSVNIDLEDQVSSLKFTLQKKEALVSALIKHKTTTNIKPIVLENPINPMLKAENECLRKQIKQLENIINAQNQGWNV